MGLSLLDSTSFFLYTHFYTYVIWIWTRGAHIPRICTALYWRILNSKWQTWARTALCTCRNHIQNPNVITIFFEFTIVMMHERHKWLNCSQRLRCRTPITRWNVTHVSWYTDNHCQTRTNYSKCAHKTKKQVTINVNKLHMVSYNPQQK